MRRTPALSPLLAACVLAGVLGQSACDRSGKQAQSAGPRDIVLIVVDTLRRDHLSPYGSSLATPTVQALADAGEVFTDVQASFHQTTMSMGALFTGRTPSIESTDPVHPLAWNGHNWCGMARFAKSPRDHCIPASLTTLAESLHAAGYWTAGVVSNRLLFEPAGFDQGFDAWEEVGTGPANLPRPTLARERQAPAVNAAVEKILIGRPASPAFLYVHYMDVHDYASVDETYEQAVERLDGELAHLLRILEGAGLRKHGVIFLTADHGENLGEVHLGKPAHSHMGNPSYEPLLEIPLIVSPALFDHPDQRLRTAGIGNLVRRAAGLPTMDGEPALAPDEVFLTERYYLTYRRGRWKSSFRRGMLGRRLLFDLESDPGETKNVIASEPETARALRMRVQELARELATRDAAPAAPSAEDRNRLRALGYLGQERAGDRD